MSSRDLRRKYGQNYLQDKAILFEMGEAIAPKEHDNFIEIGPGLGALTCLLYTSPSPRDRQKSRMPSSA